jgi:hypothetical protein
MQDMKARSHVLTIGEMLDMDWENGTRRIANMVHTNQLHTQLNYGLYGATGRVFLGPDGIFPYRPANTTLLKARSAAHHVFIASVSMPSARTIPCACAGL